jgi:hypothetical protein
MHWMANDPDRSGIILKALIVKSLANPFRLKFKNAEFEAVFSKSD